MPGTLKDVLEVGRRNLGFVEGPGENENPYAPLVGHANFQPWCASFVAAVFKRAGVSLPSTSAYTPTMANGFKSQGRWHSKGKAGDLVFFEWPGMGRIAHVGIVETARRDGSYVCIEGNTDARGGRTGGRVMRQVRRANIVGFGRPVYVAPKRNDPAKAPAKPADPVLRRGSQGARVADVQRALVRGRFLVPARGQTRRSAADGDFGPKTEAAVRHLQVKHKLKVTGVVGSLEWKALRTYA